MRQVVTRVNSAKVLREGEAPAEPDAAWIRQLGFRLGRSLSLQRQSLRTMLMVLCLIAACRQTLAQRWPDEHHDPPFYYHADFKLPQYHGLLQSVTNLKEEVPQILELQAAEEPIHVFLFRRESTYKQYVGKYFPTVPQRPALFIKQRGPGMVFARVGKELAIDLRHETTHAVLHSTLPMVPLWLDEGLAEYFETPNHQRLDGHPHLREITRLVRRGRIPSIEHLEKIGELSDMSAEHYRNAWAWVHFMLHGPPEAKTVLVSYLKDIEASIPPGRLSSRLRGRLDRVEWAFAEHFNRFR